MTNGRATPCFYIAEIVGADPHQVIGRCGDQPIRRGELFATACRYKPRERLSDFELPPELVASDSVALRVIEIRAYDQEIAEKLGAGMTGLLVLDGEGIEEIRPGMTLESKIGVLVA